MKDLSIQTIFTCFYMVYYTDCLVIIIVIIIIIIIIINNNIIIICTSHVLYNLLQSHLPETWDKRMLGYKAMGTILHIYQHID